jgi:hypothetical protein
MVYRLLHHDLITVPFVRGEVGIFWLRLYQEGKSHVATVTEVPGNPALTVTNGISEIAKALVEQHKIEPDQLVLYEIWPRGSSDMDVPSLKRLSIGRQPDWTETSRSEIEARVGGPLPKLPLHAELYARVLELGGGQVEQCWRRVFEAVPVSSLPPPHDPSSCEHHNRFAEMTEQASRRSSAPSDDVQAGKRFLDSLTPSDLRACRYHEGNWKAIADDSVQIINALGRRDGADYVAEANRSHLAERDRKWLASLFSDPVRISDGSYSSGQHRGCALRFSGAERAAVVTGYEPLGEECIDWTYEGDG